MTALIKGDDLCALVCCLPWKNTSVSCNLYCLRWHSAKTFSTGFTGCFACAAKAKLYLGKSEEQVSKHWNPLEFSHCCSIGGWGGLKSNESLLHGTQLKHSLTFSPCNAGTESRKPWKLSLMWSLRLRSSALWCARLSACKRQANFSDFHTHTHVRTPKYTKLQNFSVTWHAWHEGQWLARASCCVLWTAIISVLKCRLCEITGKTFLSALKISPNFHGCWTGKQDGPNATWSIEQKK